MPVTTDDKQQSKSTTLPVSQLTIKKTLSLTSSQCKRPLTDKLSSGNFSSVFKLKVPRHSQDRESDVLFKSYGQSNAREIGNFQQGHRKQRKIQESVGATKSGSYKRRIMNRQQPHATLESEREKLETEEDKLGNCHNDPDHNVDTVWYKGLWWAVKKQAKKIANSNADADSSSDESVSFDSHDTRRPSDSTGNNFEKLVSNENLAIRSSKGVQVNHESQKRDKRDKKEPSVQASIILDKNCIYTHPLTPAVSSYHGIPNQGREVTKLRPEQILSPLLNNSKMFLPEELRKSFIKRLKLIHSENSNKEERCNTQVNEKENKDEEKEEVAENLQENGENLVSSQNLYIPTTQDQRQDENSNKEERCNTQVNEKENEDEENEEVAENLEKNGENLVTSQDLDIPTTQDQIQDEKMFLPEELRKSFIKRLKSIHSENSITHFKLLVDRMTTSEKTGEKPEEDFKLLAYSRTSIEKIEKLVEISVLLEEVRRNFFNRSKSKHSKDFKLLAYSITSSKKIEKLLERHKGTEASEASMNRPIHPVDRHTTYNSQEDNRIGMRGSMINENVCKVQDKQIPSSQVNTDISSDESWSRFESTLIRLYRNVIRNETSRMTSSIDMAVFEAEPLFGLERSRIFFDLLDEELCHFGSAGAISEFVPNMAESTDKQHVISFFEHAYDIMSRLMTLLRCLDSKILQQMPVQNFISLMKSVIKSSLKAETKGREKLSLEGNIYTMVDPMDFERAQGEEIPEDVLDRLRNEDKMVEYSFLDTRLEIHQPSGRIENMPIDSVYYPSVFRLSPYIPTANGCYWHQSDMWRADGISQHGSMVNENGCKVQDQQIPSSEANTDASSDKSWSTFESTLIRLYRNVIKNETSRMMSSIDMVGFGAEHLFGLERSRIFFDLLDEELCQFESAGAISEFVPNMAESTVRQHVISFFEKAYDTMRRLMTLLSCPDSKILQQMPVQNFKSIMKSVIKSSLKSETKGREKPSLEGNIYTMVDPKDFERALGEEIPEDVLNRLGKKDEMVVHRFVDTRLERHQPSDREKKRPILCPYFPSDCRLFISIPTANGSYWHESDMQRANRILRHSR